MSAQIVRLPTAATNHIAVYRAGRYWHVDLVTPCGGYKPLRTTIARVGSLAAAIAYAEPLAARMQRPLRLPREARGISP